MAAQLPVDVLWHIFLHNADTTSDMQWGELERDGVILSHNTLLLARFESQVCRHWRSAILGFSSIWGHIINTRILGQSQENWRTEVLRRTGDTPLRVFAVVGRDCDRWVTAFLEEHWNRIEEITLYLERIISKRERRSICEVLMQRSSTLTSLVIHPRSSVILDLSTLNEAHRTSAAGREPIVGFPGNLPALKSLKIEDVAITLNSHSAHAFVGLRSLYLRISISMQDYIVYDILAALGAMPCLQSFGLCDNFWREKSMYNPGKPQTLEGLTLPLLFNFSIKANISTCGIFLENIKPHPKRRLYVGVTQWSVDLTSNPELVRFKIALQPHAECYMNTSDHIIEQLKLTLLNLACLSVSQSDTFPFHFFNPEFSICHFSLTTTPAETSNPYRHCRFDTVKELEIEQPGEQDLIMNIYGSEMDCHDVSFFRLFRNVEVLKISTFHIEVLLDRFGDDIPFPHMKTLALNFVQIGSSPRANLLHRICKWLKNRSGNGEGIKVIDLGELPWGLDARCLNDLGGLTVRWQTSATDGANQYVCGSEELDCLMIEAGL